MALALVCCSIEADQGGTPHARARVSLVSWEGRSHALLFMVPYCVYALVGGAISICDPYICAVSRVCANESHAVFHGPVVCAGKT